MHFTLATVVAALPFLVTAVPPAHSADIGGGVGIPISKHSEITNSDGSVNIQVLRAHVAYTKAKFERGFENYERNTGGSHPLSGKVHQLQERGEGGDPLAPFGRQLWYGKISVGNPPKTYTVDFDTGSSDLFLPGPTCGNTCSGHTIYNPGFSAAARDLHKTFSLAYGDGSTVSGEQYTDTVTVAGLIATQQTLGAANQYSTGFASSRFPADGLLGLAFESISDYNANPVFQTLVAQRKVSNPEFAFKLAQTGSELYLGGTNRQLYNGEFTYVGVSRRGYWEVSLDALSSGGEDILTNVDSIIDTGTTLIVGDTSSVAQFYEAIGGQDASDVGPGFYSFPCNNIPDVSLTFGGKSFPISQDTFNIGSADGGFTCVGGIVGQDIGAPFWIIGDVFLNNVYTVFDVGNSRVGFAELASV
ncbi:acid protease [Leucogyrophana mollusca]|uniref:Acid protease n=1 Tax=Leucogyrophana mollusca TaxID=85980 RepID=A0ACB8B1K1_9AGAM|nr:acid protease [Leucogyrophana mollusca]